MKLTKCGQIKVFRVTSFTNSKQWLATDNPLNASGSTKALELVTKVSSLKLPNIRSKILFTLFA